MKVFLAGIIQGSKHGDQIHSQEYRPGIRRMLNEVLPEAKIYCPIENHPASLDYETDKARKVFFELMQKAAESDVVIAFIPEASMGTAVELWRAYENKKVVLAVSPLVSNWAVRFLADKIFPDTESLEHFLKSPEFRSLLAKKGA